MMKAKIKYITVTASPDLTPESYRPEKARNFRISWELLIGPEGLDGEEVFGIEICTPEWLTQTWGPDGVVSGQDYIIVFEYNSQTIIDFLKSYIENISAPTWNEIAQKISKIAHWEFDDYKR